MLDSLFHFYKVKKDTPTPESFKVLGFEMVWGDVLEVVLKEGLEEDLEINSSMMVKVVKVYKNKRNTLSLICTPQHIALYGNQFESSYSDYVKGTYKHEPVNVKEGDHLMLNFYKGWGDHEMREHRYVATGGTLKEWKEVIDEIGKVRSQYSFPEMARVPNIDGGASIDLSQFRRVLKDSEEAVVAYLKMEEEEKREKEKAMNAVVVEGNKITWKAVDDVTYSVTNMKKENLSRFIFLGRYETSAKENYKMATCLHDIVQSLLVEDGEHMLSANGRELTIEHKKFDKGNSKEIHRDYINGENIAGDNVSKIVHDYIIKGFPIPLRVKVSKEGVLKKPEYEERLIKGNIVDLEGTFMIEVTCHKKEGKWYMEVCGEDIRVMGGVESIDSMGNVTKENSWRWTSHSSQSFLTKLEKAIGNDKALEVFDRLKMMAILSEKLGGVKDGN
jgi:hypothetical protein